ncbi:hypothetical protein GDO86_002027 [Hymenochirus boettgeri]|uniref:Zinc finger CCHC domain-containing protein 8 n=1 Tax=Hymenochirus boettgeri TaxID=247094 RepID=A0A8T2KNE4_9PIPI|nr:hypothetical protein GDO86_002027 [Hymenochirus boettgeri]
MYLDKLTFYLFLQVVGSVLYFTDFCLDKLGQPLLNENPQLTDGWEIPKYPQIFTQIVSLDGQEIQVKAKRPKACCFNCGSEEHQIRDCPKPRDQAHINMKKKEFLDACGEAGYQNQQRYHAEVEERFGKFKPGIVSDELQDALGISDKNLPPFIYRMRELGYPPGWLKEAELENSGLSLYDGKDASDGEIVDKNMDARKCVSYDISKLISFPGFNISSPPGITDDWRVFGSKPMQQAHQKDVFASYLNFNFPSPSHTSNKRSSPESSSSKRKRQKLSGNGMVESSVDMDLESGEEMNRSHEGVIFYPPLPPGSPLCGTPPPLPRGSPPATPPNFIPPPPPTPTPPPLPKGTPPPTPSRDSPEICRLAKCNLPAQDVDEDTWTLEQLEEQHRLLCDQLNNAESTSSDCDIHTPATGSSVTSSPSRTDLDIVTRKKFILQKSSQKSCDFPDAVLSETDEIGMTPEEDSQTNEDIANESFVIEDTREQTLDQEKEKLEVDEGATEEAACAAPSPKKSSIPDMSKFAEGITPFEYDNMSESTGVYLRLRHVLKHSPRNQQRSKKSV